MTKMTDAIAPKEQTRPRDRIVDAAIMLFWRDGYHAVSTEMICRAAGVLNGSLYHAFPSKADVLAACLEEVWTRDWNEIMACYSRATTPEAQLRAHLHWFAESQRLLKKQCGMVLGTFDIALGVSLPEVAAPIMRKRHDEHFARLKASIAGVMGTGANDEADATWLTEIATQLLGGTMIRARLSNDLAPLEKLPDTIFRLIRAVCRPAA
jgi:TetR/AcrR family transcriptional regulator, transcriptional repressor for nem operon